MSNPRFQLLSKILLGSALVMVLLGLYMLLVRQNVLAGSVLLLVAVSDVVLALVFARKTT